MRGRRRHLRVRHRRPVRLRLVRAGRRRAGGDRRLLDRLDAGGPDPVSLVLAGAAVSALLAAVTQAIIVRDSDTLDSYRFWVVGSAGRDMSVFWQVLPFLLLGLLLAAASTPGLNLLQLGDDVAASLGPAPRRQKALGIAAVMLLTGGATAACGPIGFVGLVVPHLARRIGGVDYRWVVPFSALLGALVLASPTSSAASSSAPPSCRSAS